jgi:thioredoxin-related protein
MHRHVRLSLTLLLLATAPRLGHAVPHADTGSAQRARMALIVIEVPGCFYCRLFRRDVGPAYEASPRAREVPMHYLDLEAAKARRLAFQRPIDVLPTVVLLRNGREVERIAGYMAPENFIRVINYLLSRMG